MNITFFVHFFPPLNSTGARRILAFAKYLHLAGHKIFIISTVKTEKDGLLSEAVPDYCHLTQVSWLGKKTIHQHMPSSEYQKQSGGRSRLGLILIKIRRWLMRYSGQLIDHRLLFAAYFLKPKLPNELKKLLQATDIFISSFPPWPMHLAGLICSRRFQKPWIADYRDQFSGSHFFLGTKISRALEIMIDKWMLNFAKAVTVVSSPMQEYYSTFNRNVQCIENGFDEQQFVNEKNNINFSSKDKKNIYIRYLGKITRDRIPVKFLSALARIITNGNKSLIVEFYGESKLLECWVKENIPELLKHNLHPCFACRFKHTPLGKNTG